MILVGVFVWLGFGRHADWTSLRFYTATLKRTEGVIESVAPTGFFAGSEGAYKSTLEVRFAFEDPGGVRRRGRSWSENKPPRPGEKVQIEFDDSDPDVARIVNLRSGMLPLGAGCVLAFPIIGALFIARAMAGEYDDTSADDMPFDQESQQLFE